MIHYAITELLYGIGLRLMEYVMLRVKGIDLTEHQILAHENVSAMDSLDCWNAFDIC
jgi:site-specific recombinase XerC